MNSVHTVKIEVVVTDRAALAAFAKKRAADCGIGAREFTAHETQAYSAESEIAYWLGWAFDNGTLPDCGFEIQETVVDDGGL
jgi:hypothetical protein